MEVGPPVPQPPWVLRVLRPTAPGRDTDGPRKSPGQNAASGRRSDKPGHGRWQNRLGGNVDGGRGSRDHTPRTGLQSPQGRSSAQFWWQRGGPQCSATSPPAPQGTWERMRPPRVLGPAALTRRNSEGAEAGNAMGAIQGACPHHLRAGLEQPRQCSG